MAAAYQEIRESLMGGLNTAENPSQLEPGELQEMTGLEYRPPRTGIFAIPGRTRYDASGIMTGDNIFGLVFAQFDVSATATSGSGQRLVAFNGSSAFYMVATGSTATPVTIKRDLTIGASAYADGCHYNNNWFFWNGTDYSWAVLGTNMTASAHHGLFAATATPTCVATALATAYANSIGTFEVWITEFVGDATGLGNAYTQTTYPRLESAWVPPNGTLSTLQQVTLSATGLGIKITFPSVQSNADTTNETIWWRVYCSLADGKYPYGYSRGLSGVTGVGGDIRTSPNLGTTTTSSTHVVPKDSIDTEFVEYTVVQPPGGVAVSANYQPPRAFDLVVFQDSIVTIDADNRQLVKYSLPDSPHYFPVTYYIPFETETQDKLTSLEVCNNALLVFSSYYGFRVDDLPRAQDGDDIFSNRSRAKEPFANNHGAVGPRCTAVFDIFGSGQLCLFACRDGIHITDGFKMDYASNNFDWDTRVDKTRLYRSTLKNNPERHRVEFTYYDAVDLYWRRLDFYYHPKFLKHGDGSRTFPELPLGGPHPVPGPACALGTINDKWKMWCGLDTLLAGEAQLFMEGTGTEDNAKLSDSNTNIWKRLRTRDFYPAGTNGEFAIPHAYVNQSSVTASGSGTAMLYARYDESGVYTATATVDQSKSNNQPLRFSGANVAPENRMQAASVRIVKDDGGTWQELNYITLVVDKSGKVKSAVSNA
jgi:hypothetical protein